jgi:hypothetical protein
VAWLGIACGFKATLAMDAGKLFVDASDWYHDWPSSTGSGPVPHSQTLNRRLWALHDYMETSCEGETLWRNIQRGAKLFRDYDVQWRWAAWDGATANYAWASSINAAGLPYLLSATSDWKQLPSTVGAHTVVVVGYNDNDQHIRVALGWGDRFPVKWIPFSELAEVRTDYVHSWTAAKIVPASVATGVEAREAPAHWAYEESPNVG